MNALLMNLDRLHTTEMGMDRIKRNLSLDTIHIVEWCKEQIMNPDAVIDRRGKNWYVRVAGFVFTVNVHSYTIITAHKERR